MQTFLRGGLRSLSRPLSTSGIKCPQNAAIPRTFRSFHQERVGALPMFNAFQPNLFNRKVAAGIASVSLLGLGLAINPVLQFEPSPPVTRPSTPAQTTAPAVSPPPPSPPQSSINAYELSFGTVCGICAGVFVKKGAKAMAFFLGGIFVLLQYFTSFSLVKVDWTKLGSRFERQFHSQPAGPGGESKPPTVYNLWLWFVNFLTADFPPRATFIAGFILGLRIG